MMSDQETDSSTSSPQSYVQSPHSSPSQQVPHLTNYMNILSCGDSNYNMETGMETNQPYLVIVEQPSDYFRFRYKSEMVGTHGCLTGKTSSSCKSKTFPSVALMNYSDRAIIQCSLAQYKNHREHPHKLIEEDEDKMLQVEVNPQKGYEVRFPGLGIIHTAKKDVPDLLYKKMSERLTDFNVEELKSHCTHLAKTINLNIVCLKFSACNMNGEKICDPVFSEPIHNLKSASTNDLKISRMSLEKGKPTGGDTLFLLTEKVKKNDIEVHFVEMEEGEVVWTGFGRFTQSQVHHQYAIVCGTPKYKNPDITSNVDVYVQLYRPSDKRTSDRLKFTYVADEVIKQSMKRKKNNSYSSIGSSSGGSIKSLSDVPETVLMANQKNGLLHFNNGMAMVNPNNIHHVPMHSDVRNIYPHNDNGLSDALYADSMQDQVMHTPSPMLGQPNVPETPIYKNDSLEIEKLLRNNSNPDEEVIRLMKEYAVLSFPKSDIEMEYNSNSITSFGNNDFSFITESIQLKPDSGRGQGSSSQKKPKIAMTSSHSTNTKNSYEALYTQEDGIEVKKIVKELCEIIRNKAPHNKVEIRSKLERLFQLRLSNGDTFLHMTLSNDELLPSMEFIVKLIDSLNMTQLLNIKNHIGQTILHTAVINDLPHYIQFLLSKGCDPMSEDVQGDNVVHYAVKCRNCLGPLLESMLKLDLEYDLNASNKEKHTPLHLAAVHNSDASVKLLLSHNASWSVRDVDGRTPLHLAAYYSHLTVMKELLEYIPASEVDVVDGHGCTALQIACGSAFSQSSIQIVELLLQRGADPLTSEHGDPAWRITKQPEIRELIRKYAPSVDQQMINDDVKSEPEDEFESADEGDEGLEGLSVYIYELSDILDRSGKWRELAVRLQCESLLNYYDKTPSPTKTLLDQVKVCKEDVTSKSLAKILRDMGELEAAAVIHRYDYCSN